MLVYFILIFLTLLFYFIFFKTPFWISNLTFEFGKYRTIHLKYIISKNNIDYVTPSYRFRHSEYDGKLISNIIKSKNFKIHKMPKIHTYDLYHKNNMVNSLLNIDEKSYNNNYTKFANVCANVIKYVTNNGHPILNVAVVVNNRSDTNFYNGNYISFAFFKIYQTMNMKTILIKYYNAVNYARNKESKNFSLYDLYKLYNCDLILNSWRDLSHIKNKYNLLLNRYEGNILEREYILDFLQSKSKRKLVYFDFFDNEYIINKLEVLEV